MRRVDTVDQQISGKIMTAKAHEISFKKGLQKIAGQRILTIVAASCSYVERRKL
jgi:hypothetical protein